MTHDAFVVMNLLVLTIVQEYMIGEDVAALEDTVWRSKNMAAHDPVPEDEDLEQTTQSDEWDQASDAICRVGLGPVICYVITERL